MNVVTLVRRHGRDFAKAFFGGLMNSGDTVALLNGEELSSVWQMPRIVPIMEGHPEGRDILRDRPVISSATTDFDALRALPSDRLGHRYLAHLDANGLDPDALTTAVTRGPDERSNYMLERIRQTHDIWHAVLGLGTQGYEEVLVHAFQWPQLRMNYSAMVVGFGAIKHFLGEQRWGLMRRDAIGDAVRAGRAAQPLVPVYWERYWDAPIADVRKRLQVTPAAAWPSYRMAA